FNDDVQCAHGATIGELDDDLLFYLRARGIPEPEARALLVQAFVGGAVETIRDETVREMVGSAVETWLGEGASV
ncbi:MAG: SufD family Fe-S cluster assembly protein, partial [Fimbriimonadaceae bacterium]|nr:SufD family Fe-S cluster assembly protein [Alphaproteobacteria bacterium]